MYLLCFFFQSQDNPKSCFFFRGTGLFKSRVSAGDTLIGKLVMLRKEKDAKLKSHKMIPSFHESIDTGFFLKHVHEWMINYRL